MNNNDLAKIICRHLTERGYAWFLLRGIENLLLGRPLNDLDIVIMGSVSCEQFINELVSDGYVVEMFNVPSDYQFKLVVCSVDVKIEIDVFRSVRWLGLPVLSSNYLYSRSDMVGGIPCADLVDSEVLILLKEALYNGRVKFWNNGLQKHIDVFSTSKVSVDVLALSLGSCLSRFLLCDLGVLGVKVEKYSNLIRLVFVFISLRRRPVSTVRSMLCFFSSKLISRWKRYFR